MPARRPDEHAVAAGGRGTSPARCAMPKAASPSVRGLFRRRLRGRLDCSLRFLRMLERLQFTVVFAAVMAAALALGVAAMGGRALADNTYPDRPIRVIVSV